jgi:hypothetical protein
MDIVDKSGFSLILLALGVLVTDSQAETIFQENFDNQPDYVSNHVQALNLASETTIPDGWYALRQSSEWDPASGDPDNHETIEILASVFSGWSPRWR